MPRRPWSVSTTAWRFGAFATLLVPLLPHVLGRYAAVPLGLGLAWLGVSLWSSQAAPADHRRRAQLAAPATAR